MTIHIIKAIFLVVVLSHVFSCSGQVKSKNKSSESQKVTLGKSVSKLDKQIWNIFQDSKANYWFGSKKSGLYLFDGEKLTQFTTEDGLPSNQIQGVQEDKNFNLLVHTGKGISKFDGKKFTLLNIIQSTDNEWKLGADDLWFANIDNGVYRYDGENVFVLELPTKDIEKVLGITASNTSYSPYAIAGMGKDKSGNVWFGTGLAGAFRFDGDSFLWIAEKELSRLEDGREPGVRSIVEDKDGNIWLSNIRYKYKITSENTYEKLPGINLSEHNVSIELPYYMSAVSDDKDNLWMVSFDEGVWKYDGEKLQQFIPKQDNKEILLLTIFKDKDGTMWLGTYDDGVYRYNGEDFEKFEVDQH